MAQEYPIMLVYKDLLHKDKVKNQADFGDKLGFKGPFTSQLLKGKEPVPKDLPNKIQSVFELPDNYIELLQKKDKTEAATDSNFQAMLQLLVQAAADAVVAAKESAIASKESAIATREATTATNTAMNMLSNSAPSVVSQLNHMNEELQVEKAVATALQNFVFEKVAQHEGKTFDQIYREFLDRDAVEQLDYIEQSGKSGGKDKKGKQKQAVGS